jgi:hypothetical protein
MSTVVFKARETLSKWYVPSGWEIGDDNSLTTIVPVAGAVSPKTEGSSYTANEKNGYVVSKDTYENGFKLTFTYSFIRNGDNGYVQPDTNANEKIDDGDTKKISFVGNSGIKLGSFQGASSGVFEVAILDTKAMVDRVSVINDGKTYTKKDAFKHWTKVTGLDYAGVPAQANGVVKFTNEFINKNSFEKVTQLMNAIGYGDTLDNNIYDYFTASSGSENWWKLYETLVNNYDHCDPNGNAIEIYWKPDIDPTTGKKLETGKLEVYLNFETEESKPNKVWKKYYSKNGVKITGSTSATNPVTLDGHIYIQTHWGSGVMFKNLIIGDYEPPVHDDV